MNRKLVTLFQANHWAQSKVLQSNKQLITSMGPDEGNISLTTATIKTQRLKSKSP